MFRLRNWVLVLSSTSLFCSATARSHRQISRARTVDRRTTTSSLPSGWSYIGCLIDGAGTRILLQDTESVSTNTPQSCIAFCSSNGYAMAGVEYSSECWCGNAYSSISGNVQTAPDSDCYWSCSGDSTQTCGGSNRLQAYKLSGSASTSSLHSTGTTSSHITSTTSSHSTSTISTHSTTSTSTVTSSTSTAPVSTATPTGKRGIAWPSTNPSNQSPEVFKSPHVSFLYDWGTSKPSSDKDIPYYAMQWSAGGIQQLAANLNATGAKTVLAFNEPDNASQSNMTAAQAAALYKEYIHPLAQQGYYLVSPAITNGGPPSGVTWLSYFFGNCTGCHIDAIAMHWYGGWTSDLESFVESGKTFGKPIYLTELGFSWDATLASYNQFFPLLMDYLDNEPAVAKYAWFGAFSDGTPRDLINSDGSLTNLGQQYISYTANSSDVLP